MLKMRLGEIKISVHRVSLRGALATKQSRRLMLRLLRFARNDLEFSVCIFIAIVMTCSRGGIVALLLAAVFVLQLQYIRAGKLGLWVRTVIPGALLIVYFGGWAAGMRSMMIHEMDSGYIRYSRQLGFKEETLMSYARRNAMLPQLTGLNLYFAALVGETIALEVIFGWPGIGKLMYEGAMNVDYPLILGSLLVIIIVVLLGNFLIDIIYGFIDPRIRTGHGR